MRYEGVNIQSGGRKEAGDESKGKGEQGRKQGNRNNWKMSIVKGEEQVRKWGKEVKCMAVWALGVRPLDAPSVMILSPFSHRILFIA